MMIFFYFFPSTSKHIQNVIEFKKSLQEQGGSFEQGSSNDQQESESSLPGGPGSQCAVLNNSDASKKRKSVRKF